MPDAHHPANAEAMPDALRWAGAYPAEAARLKGLSVRALIGLCAGLNAAREALCGVQCQPRCSEDDVFDWLEAEIERLSRIREMAMAEMEARPATGDFACEERIRIIGNYELVACGAGIVETMEKMARLYAAHERARWRQKARAGPWADDYPCSRSVQRCLAQEFCNFSVGIRKSARYDPNVRNGAGAPACRSTRMRMKFAECFRRSKRG